VTRGVSPGMHARQARARHLDGLVGDELGEQPARAGLVRLRAAGGGGGDVRVPRGAPRARVEAVAQDRELAPAVPARGDEHAVAVERVRARAERERAPAGLARGREEEQVQRVLPQRRERRGRGRRVEERGAVCAPPSARGTHARAQAGAYT
jgi:hypothetical protein